MSKICRRLGLACLLAASPLIWTSALRAATGPTVQVTSAIGQGVVRLDAKATGPFQYTLRHPNANLYYIDLSGVTAGAGGSARVLGTDIVRSYRLESDADGAKNVSRLELLVGNGVAPRLIREGLDELVIVVSKKGVFNAGAKPSQGRVVNVSLSEVRPAGSAHGASFIRQVSVAKDGNSPEVLILGSNAFEYHQLRLSHPDRLVLDFRGARMRAPKKVTSTFAPVLDVRTGQFSPKIARVVIDLAHAASYNLKHVDGGIAVEFSPTSSEGKLDASKSAAAKPENPYPGDLGHRLKLVSEESDPQAVAPPKVPQSADPAPSSSPHAEAEKAAASEAVPTPAATTPVSKPPAQSETTPPEKLAGAPAEQAASPAQTQGANNPVPTTPVNPAVAPSPVAPGEVIANETQGTGTEPTKYTGAPISVNLKNVDLQDFFRLIHEISGLNVVVGPDVKGTVTLVLDNVPWDQALDIVLQNNDLDKQLDGNVLRIATKATVRKEADEAKELAKAQAEAAPLVTTTRVLSYAKAHDLVSTIKKFLSPRGDVLADPRTNTLIISDVASVIPVVDNLIRELDKRSQQVEIEARVVAANRSFAREIGTQFAFSGAAVNGKNVFGGLSTVGTSPLTRFVPPLPAPPLIVGTSPPSGTTATGVQMPLVTNLGAAVPTSGISYAFSSTNFALDYMISAAESKGVGKLLSKPKVITQNNEQATVKQGTKIPIQTIVNNTVSVQFVDAVLELQVTPQITAQGTIFMNIHVENTQIDPSIPRVNGIPALDTQSADTKVLVNDGATVMVGGIIVSQQRTDIEEVPYVGSLPIIGRLFRHTTVSTQSQELLFFITPRILPT